ncbi:MAG: pyruvate dehydrogenase (acetyl-transferring), homodimeric type, partial [Pseudomonadota bacterium]
MAAPRARVPHPKTSEAHKEPPLPEEMQPVSNTIPEPIDNDPLETRDWVESLDAVLAHHGTARAGYIVQRVLEYAKRHGMAKDLPIGTDYVNT